MIVNPMHGAMSVSWLKQGPIKIPAFWVFATSLTAGVHSNSARSEQLLMSADWR